MRIGSLSRKITLANSKLRAVWGSGALSTACHSLLPLSRFRLDLGLIHIPLIVGPLLGSEVLDMTCTFGTHTTIQRLGMLFNIAHGPPALSLSDAVQEIKTNPSRWMRKRFAWQRGFAAFSVSA